MHVELHGKRENTTNKIQTCLDYENCPINKNKNATIEDNNNTSLYSRRLGSDTDSSLQQLFIFQGSSEKNGCTIVNLIKTF